MNNKEKLPFDQIDIERFLSSRGIQFDYEGKNIQQGWIGLKCPFCHDHSNHGGINLDSNWFKCWVCGRIKSPIEVIKKVEGCGWGKAYHVAREYLNREFKQKNPGLTRSNFDYGQSILPKEAKKKFPNLHRKYLENRGFDPDKLIEKFDLYAVDLVGDYKYRIVAPVYINGEIVNFVAADVTKKQKIPYKNAPNKAVKIVRAEIVYNIDSARDFLVVVEGLTDVWRLGDGAGATLGVAFTEQQLALIAGKKFERIYVMYDADAEEQAERLANQLSAVCQKVIVILLEEGDPADLSQSEADKIMRMMYDDILE